MHAVNPAAPVWRQLAARPDYLRLLAVRLAGQFADGVFQASLAGTILFDPERAAHAADIAAGFAVLLLPYSLLGPFAGVLLDRWSRQRVLLGANLLRAVLVCAVAGEIGAGVHGQPFYLSALAVISINRFVLSALSAAQPHVVPGEQLITANAISTTAGAAVTAAGGGLAIGIRAVSGAGNLGYASIALGSALSYVLAGLAAVGFGVRQLGPDDHTRRHSESVRNVLAGLVAGGRHLRERPAVLRALVMIGVHRFAYGVSAICTLLLYRNYFTDQGVLRAGLAGLGQIVLAIAVGGGIAAFVSPLAARRWGYARWSAALLVAAGVVELVLGLPFRLATFVPAAALLGLAAQGVKICVDTITARGVDDDYRGRVFSIYDTVFNVVFVAAGVLTALLLPENGRSVAAVVGIAVAYELAGIGYLLASRQRRGQPAVTARSQARAA
ncbi:MAG TPA: MFS transporter [Jatrophihabitans sp.]|nr:MFS transporter [Jatrophihabitans sp.]